MDKEITVGPSLLAADFSMLKDEIKRAEEAKADFLHCDIMDGHFVPNISFGPSIVKDIRKNTELTLDVHLMIEDAQKYLNAFIDAGSDIITVHIETLKEPRKILEDIKCAGLKAGISLNPETSADSLKDVLDIADMILIMTVHPGFGGQSFIKDCLPKIEKIREMFDGDLEVDGGINYETAQLAVKAGINMVIAGTHLFSSHDMKKDIENIKCLKR
ncbi:MAG: ribulose-phosphate 3-epimerase [Candidatus Kappaea frigidicola]|nr:ribulose-phosphate 3-epimerase [Candidatus Kappaea frigidicola]